MPAEAAVALRGTVEAVVPWVFGALGAISLTAAPSVSLEGRSAWFMLTLPVDFGAVLASKLLANLVVAVPAVAMSSALLLVGGFGPWAVLRCALCAVGMLIGFASLGLALDTLRPNYSFTAPAEVVKRGLPIIAGVLGGLVTAALFGYVSFKLYGAHGAAASDALSLVVPVLLALAGSFLVAFVSRLAPSD